jgi:hypothetical protein
VRIGRATAFRWTLVPIALSYVAGLLLVANLVFGASTFFGQGVSTPPARTGSYDSRRPAVAPVEDKQVARAITEVSGGSPTIGLPLPDDSSSTPALTAVAFRSPSSSMPIRSSTQPSVYGNRQGLGGLYSVSGAYHDLRLQAPRISGRTGPTAQVPSVPGNYPG